MLSSFGVCARLYIAWPLVRSVSRDWLTATPLAFRSGRKGPRTCVFYGDPLGLHLFDASPNGAVRDFLRPIYSYIVGWQRKSGGCAHTMNIAQTKRHLICVREFPINSLV